MAEDERGIPDWGLKLLVLRRLLGAYALSDITDAV